MANPKRISLIYVVTYLTIGGIGLTFFPDLFLRLFQSNQEYGQAMPRIAGVLMLALAGLIGRILQFEDYKYYGYSILARTVIVLVLFYVYSLDRDPFFAIISGIVLIGLIPSYVIAFRTKRGGERTEDQ